MCGIVGMSFKDGFTQRSSDIGTIKEDFTKMLVAAEERGRAATGIVIVSRTHDSAKPKAAVLRAPLPASDFVKTEPYKKLINLVNISTLSIIGHTRAVSSMYASARDNKNNHPHICGSIVGVHNGKVINDESLWKEYAKKITPQGKCDSEVIFSLINSKLNETTSTEKAIVSALKEIRGWYALALINLKEPGKVFIVKDDETTPLELAWYPYNGVVLFASKAEYIKSNPGGKNGTLQFKQFSPGRILTLDCSTKDNDYSNFYVKSTKVEPALTAEQRRRMISDNKEDFDITQGL